jgi:inosine-uridine nucleoside N-ribohydrolase
MPLIHLDTDLGGDIDDLCALALLLRSPDVELAGVTTVGEIDGKRAGYVRYALRLEGRDDIPVAAGADNALGRFRAWMGLPPEDRYWPEPVAPAPGPLEDALDLLKRSIEQGATVVAIGPYTNLHLLDIRYPGILAQAKLYLMGGYVYPPRAGFPQWQNEDDYNVQTDVAAARHVLSKASPTLIPLSITAETALRRTDLPALRAAGALGDLIARQAEAFAQDERHEATYGQSCPGLPPDIINFQHDPLACAAAIGRREGIEIEELRLRAEIEDGWLTERIHPSGNAVRVVTRVDAAAFSRFWLGRVAPEAGA